MRKLIWLGTGATMAQGQMLADGLKATLVHNDANSVELVAFETIPCIIGNQGAKERLEEMRAMAEKKKVLESGN